MVRTNYHFLYQYNRVGVVLLYFNLQYLQFSISIFTNSIIHLYCSLSWRSQNQQVWPPNTYTSHRCHKYNIFLAVAQTTSSTSSFVLSSIHFILQFWPVMIKFMCSNYLLYTGVWSCSCTPPQKSQSGSYERKKKEKIWKDR